MSSDGLDRPDKDSPNVLAGGTWVRRGPLVVWQPEQPPAKADDPTMCPCGCGATLGGA